MRHCQDAGPTTERHSIDAPELMQRLCLLPISLDTQNNFVVMLHQFNATQQTLRLSAVSLRRGWLSRNNEQCSRCFIVFVERHYSTEAYHYSTLPLQDFWASIDN